MKLRAEVDGESFELELVQRGADWDYSLRGAHDAGGSASVAWVSPGVFSLLIEKKSFTVYISENISENKGLLEAWTGAQRHMLSIADPRDRPANSKKAAAAGPVEIRALMPGRIIKLLVRAGAPVQAGQGIIVVEAMKMQNEMKSPRDGVVSHVRVEEGNTVGAGEIMMVIE